ncbi:MAG: YfhO family protein [candidate division KSB1 bacterium]|nr:YfhO family protein [candidate division KSB1 bacterium]
MAEKGRKSAKAHSRRAETKRPSFVRRHPDWTVGMGLGVLLLAYYAPVVFYNQTLLPPDTLASKSFGPFIRQCLSQHEYPKWNPYIFCGMPSFASLTAAPYVDLLSDLLQAILWIPRQILPGGDFLTRLANYFLFGFFAYLYLRRKGIRPEAGMFAAAGLVLLPEVVAYAAFGHGTKLNSVALIPLILLLAEELVERRTLLLFAATALAVGFQMLRAHVQISYYTFLALALYGLWSVGWRLAKERRFDKGLLGGIVLLGGAVALGVLMSSWLYLSVHEYSRFSIRGGPEGGLSYGYATNWSFPPAELITFFVPSYFGFGGQTYWGEMPFTDFPRYFGVTVLFFAAVALLVRRDRWTWFLFALGLFSLVVSFGRHLPLLYDPMFRYLPYFNKFRVPVMIHVLLGISLLLLAGVGVHELLERRAGEKPVRGALYALVGISFLLFALVAFGKGAILDAIARSGKVAPALHARAYEMALRDGLKMLVLIAVLGALTWAFLRRKISPSWFAMGAFALLLVDLWPVSHRLLDPQPEASETEYFRADPAVQFVKKQDGLFRIYPIADPRPANWYAYHFLQNIYGYHAAKLKLYQSFLDSTHIADTDRYGFPLFLSRYYRVVQRGGRLALERTPPEAVDRELARLHDKVLDLLNVRYLLSPYSFADSTYRLAQGGQLNVVENPDALPRAFVVDSVIVVRSEEEAYAVFRSPTFDPRRAAILLGQPDLAPQRGARGEARVVKYGPHRIVLDAEATGPSCLVLSEVYYPAGWKARIDGHAVPIHRADVILRGIMLPAGKHRVELVFDPETFRLGLIITVAVTGTLLALLAWAWFGKHQRFAMAD